MTLHEVKLVLTWTKERLDKAQGSKHSNPDIYQEKYNQYKAVCDLYDEMCEELLDEIVKNRDL